MYIKNHVKKVNIRVRYIKSIVSSSFLISGIIRPVRITDITIRKKELALDVSLY